MRLPRRAMVIRRSRLSKDSTAWATSRLHRVNGWSLLACLAFVACSTSPRPSPERSFDSAPWLEDLAQLEDVLGQRYANLDWNVRHRGLDAAALDRTTREAISRAGSEREALEAIVRFVAAFRDPHL